MAATASCIFRLLLLAWLSSLAAAQQEVIWGAVVISMFGDRVPLLSPAYSTLTTNGATQMFNSGSFFRQRYIDQSAKVAGDNSSASGNYTIHGISKDNIDNLQISVDSSYEVFIVQGAQAFMSGLYPPLEVSTGSSTGGNSSSSGDSDNSSSDGESLANGTVVAAPLNGAQFPQLYVASPVDPNYIQTNGSENCPAFDESVNALYSSSDFVAKQDSLKKFYSGFSAEMASALPNSDLSYRNAYQIYDWLSFGALHDQTMAGQLNDDDISRARALANQWAWSVYGNTSADNGIRTIGGAAILSQVVDILLTNAQRGGDQYKLSMSFTSFESMVSLAALLRLTDLFTGFEALPDFGSAFSFELYSMTTDDPNSSNLPYPSRFSDLRVRFLFRNGTDPESPLSSFPILGKDRTDLDWTFQDFLNTVTGTQDTPGIALSGVASWCNTCRSHAVFCPGYLGDDTNSHNQRVSPVVAGVIGAMVTLAVIGALFVGVMLCFGVRFARRRNAGLIAHAKHARRTSSMRNSGVASSHRSSGGFKGAEKLASDVDLPRGAGSQSGSGGVFGAEVISKGESGHKRVESWEMREGGKKKATQNEDEVNPVEVP